MCCPSAGTEPDTSSTSARTALTQARNELILIVVTSLADLTRRTASSISTPAHVPHELRPGSPASRHGRAVRPLRRGDTALVDEAQQLALPPERAGPEERELDFDQPLPVGQPRVRLLALERAQDRGGD